MSKNSTKGIVFMVISALLTAFGQLFWKLGVSGNLLLILVGFVFYGVGAITMIYALKFGKLSVLHPVMCVGYIFAILNGRIFLNETVSITQMLGILVIVLGVIMVSKGGVCSE